MRVCDLMVQRPGPMQSDGRQIKEERLCGVPMQSLIVETDGTLSLHGHGMVVRAWGVDNFQEVD